MPKPVPDRALKTMLDERNISLWQAYHYKTAASTGKYATSKDPVAVMLKTPDAIEMNFHGYGATLDEAVRHALTFNFNIALRLREPGLYGAMARLEAALAELWAVLYKDRPEDDDDIPF